MNENTPEEQQQPGGSVKKELISGVFYTAMAKYTGILVTLVVSGVLGRLLTPEQFGVITAATVFITFFSIFTDMGIGPAVIQHQNLGRRDLEGIFTFTLWAGVLLALLFAAAAGPIASFYHHDPQVRNICHILALNLLLASANIVPNALILKQKRFRFAAVRSLSVQVAGGVAAVAAAYAGAGIYALTINPILSSLLMLVVNYRQNPLRLRLKPRWAPLRKIFSFSAFQFSFELINYFSRNLDKLLMGRMSLTDLGYYDKSYRLMMLPLQYITFIVSPVMHPVFARLQDNREQLAGSYLKVIRLLAFIGLPLAAGLWFSARELLLIIFGGQWEPSVPVFKILALTVGLQVVGSTAGAIFQAANATRLLFVNGVISAVLNVSAICTGIYVFGTMEAVAWCICLSFTLNFIQTYFILFRRALHVSWLPFWRGFLSPLLLTALVCLPLGLLQGVLPADTPLLLSLAAKGVAGAVVWVLYIHLSGEYNLKESLGRLRSGKF